MTILHNIFICLLPLPNVPRHIIPYVILFFKSPKPICAAQYCWICRIWLKHDWLIKGYPIAENWLFFFKQLIIANTSTARDEIVFLTPLSILGFCGVWACISLVYAITTAASDGHCFLIVVTASGFCIVSTMLLQWSPSLGGRRSLHNFHLGSSILSFLIFLFSALWPGLGLSVVHFLPKL